VETTLEAVSIAGRVASIRERVDIAARKSARVGTAITLIAVTKSVDAATAREAVAAGALDLGENRVQELVIKAPSLQDLAQIRWHLIGRLQRNKVAKAVALAGAIHGIDSVELATHVSQAAMRLGRSLDVFAQINVSDEASKAGFAPLAFQASAPDMSRLPGLRWRGLMTIAPEGAPAPTLHAVFGDLRRLHERCANDFDDENWNALSMGMTDDFEIAIAEGATHVRVGRAIFGERDHARTAVMP
jgi:PLP dependent protein